MTDPVTALVWLVSGIVMVLVVIGGGVAMAVRAGERRRDRD